MGRLKSWPRRWNAGWPTNPWRAHRETWTARARRWMRKHPRVVSTAAATVLVGLIGFSAIAQIVTLKNRQLASANGELAQTNQELEEANQSLEIANQDERCAREEAETVLAFFREKVLAAARPRDQEGGLGVGATVRDAVDAAEPLIVEAFANKPLIEAAVRSTLGGTYFYLGEPKLAIAQHQRSLELYRTHLGDKDPETLQAMNELALGFKYDGRPEEAFELAERVLQTTEEQKGASDPDTLTYKNNLGEALRAAGKLDRSLELLQDTFKRRKETLGLDHPHTLITMNNLAMALEDAGHRDQAILLFEEALERRRKTLGPRQTYTLQSMNNLAAAYAAGGEPERAVKIHEEALKILEEELTADHPMTSNSRNNLANALLRAGDADRALALHEDNLRRRSKRLGAAHPATLQTLSSLTAAYFTLDKSQDATASLERFASEQRKTLPDDAPALAALLQAMAELLLRHQAHASAEPYLRECLAWHEQHRPEDWSLWEIKSLLGAALAGQQDFASAEPLLIAGYEGLLQRRDAVTPADGSPLAAAADRLIELYTAWDQPDQAELWRKKRDAIGQQ